VVHVPAASADAPFVLNDVTRDFQEGHDPGPADLCVVERTKLATLLDFSSDGRSR
jgi:hypothetical protein